MEGISVTKRCNVQGMVLFDYDDPAVKEYLEYSITRWICVEGYNTSLPRTKIEELLRNHFGSCGYLHEIYFPGESNSCAYLLIYGNGGASNAVKLSGSMMGGHKIVAQATGLSRPQVENYITGTAVDNVPAADKVDMMEIDS